MSDSNSYQYKSLVKMPASALRTKSNYIVYESHNFKKTTLPFIFDIHVVERRHTSAYANNDYFQHCKCEALNWHENPEFLYISKGSGTISCGLETISVTKGDIVTINSNTTHGVCYDNDYEYYYLIIDKSFFSTNGIDISKTTFATLVQNRETTEKFKEIISSFTEKQDFQEPLIRSAVLNFLIDMCKNHQSPTPAINTTTKSLRNINVALGFIDANLTEKLSIDSIAFEVGLSKFHFSREFKKLTGKTVIDYINMRRCEIAKRLLINENYSVAETAEKCGFDNPTYFSETFKKYIGLSPANFVKSSL